MTVQCGSRIVTASEDTSLDIAGSEAGRDRVGYMDRDILYLNRGSNAGVKVGDVYTTNHFSYKVKHPVSGRVLGEKVETTGWVRIVLVAENSATAVVERACLDIHQGDYLRPFEKARVPLVSRRAPVDRLTPPSGKATGYIVDSQNDAVISSNGNTVSVDLGSKDGIAPGNLMTVYRIMNPSVPTARNVIAELAILTVGDNTALGTITYSNDAIMVGDHVELR
jgi:hypothetical protein